MSHAREERYPSAATLLHDLEAYMASAGESATVRDIGKLVSDRFAAERAQMRNLVEEHMTAAKDSTRAVPALELSQLSATSLSGIAGLNEGSVSGGGSSSAARSQNQRSLQGLASAPSSAPPPTANRSPMLLAGAGIVVGGIVVGALAFGMRGSHEVADGAPALANVPVVTIPSATTAPTPPAPSASASGSTAAHTVNVRIRVSPPTATLSIDGATVPGNPFVGTFPRGTEVHSLRAIAPGYLAKADDTSVDMSLERQQQVIYRRGPGASQVVAPSVSPAATPAPAAAPGPGTAASPDINPNGGHAPRRTIDPNNPYGNP
jgi:hypothetical protein